MTLTLWISLVVATVAAFVAGVLFSPLLLPSQLQDMERSRSKTKDVDLDTIEDTIENTIQNTLAEPQKLVAAPDGRGAGAAPGAGSSAPEATGEAIERLSESLHGRLAETLREEVSHLQPEQTEVIQAVETFLDERRDAFSSDDTADLDEITKKVREIESTVKTLEEEIHQPQERERLRDKVDNLDEEKEELREKFGEKLKAKDEELEELRTSTRNLDRFEEDLKRTKKQLKTARKEKDKAQEKAESLQTIEKLFSLIYESQSSLFDAWARGLASFSPFFCLVDYSLLRWMKARLSDDETLETAMMLNLLLLTDIRIGNGKKCFQEGHQYLLSRIEERKGNREEMKSRLERFDTGRGVKRTAAFQKMIKHLRAEKGLRREPFYVGMEGEGEDRRILKAQ